MNLCNASVTSPRGVTVPGFLLAPLLRLRMSGTTWRIIITLLLSPQPMSARLIAKRTRRDYGLVKRVVRGLVAWKILERTPDGLQVQRDTAHWGPPLPGGAAVPVHGQT